MIPPIDRKEWHDLVSGKINPAISSHLLKIRLNTLKKKVKLKIITLEEAVRELHYDCKSHQDIYRNDLYQIFKKENADLF